MRHWALGTLLGSRQRQAGGSDVRSLAVAGSGIVGGSLWSHANKRRSIRPLPAVGKRRRQRTLLKK